MISNSHALSHARIEKIWKVTLLKLKKIEKKKSVSKSSLHVKCISELLLHINVIIVIIYKISTYRNKAYFIKRICRQHRICQMIKWKMYWRRLLIFNLSKKFILKVIKIKLTHFIYTDQVSEKKTGTACTLDI